ncbi:hypothetical protein HMPREF1861_01048 [Corynebacterium kroppenstedtii]|nr:hypothetical protein HMPREF1861_01048 [Corynebacterium kroppenstedtii]
MMLLDASGLAYLSQSIVYCNDRILMTSRHTREMTSEEKT